MSSPREIGIFSDIHGNRQAFAAIVSVIEGREDLQWLCLGDIVGWFFRPVQCVRMVIDLVTRGRVTGVVPGNHDLLALDRFRDDPSRVDRHLATAYSAGALSECPDATAFLRSLRNHVLEGETWSAAHHSPFGLPAEGQPPTYQQYGVIEQDLLAHLSAWTHSRKEALLTGHGHVGCVYEIPAGLRAPTMGDVTIWRPSPDDRHFTVPLRPDRRYWVRNAAVGGPYLDNVVASNWAEYRPGDCVILHRESYDTRELEADIHAHRHVMTHRDTWQTRVLKLLAEQTPTT